MRLVGRWGLVGWRQVQWWRGQVAHLRRWVWRRGRRPGGVVGARARHRVQQGRLLVLQWWLKVGRQRKLLRLLWRLH